MVPCLARLSRRVLNWYRSSLSAVEEVRAKTGGSHANVSRGLWTVVSVRGVSYRVM